MNPLLLIAVSAWIGKMFQESFRKEKELAEISSKTIFTDFLIECNSPDELRSAKSRITRSVNQIIVRYKQFKIGKTGRPTRRNHSHRKYKYMFLLCSSKSAAIIEELEAYYNEKYLQYPGNENQRTGSAGVAQTVHGRYYLYVVCN